MPEGRGPRFFRSPVARRALVVFLVALAVRLLYIATILPTGCLAINDDPISDMETFQRWAGTIVAGDWLGREEFHPYHPWQEGIADEATWLSWYGPRVFHQDPLYPYFVALIYSATGPRALTVILVQLLLGAGVAAGITFLAHRLSTARASLAAGLLAALYAPFLFYESLLLRDTLLVFLSTVFLIAVEEARRRSGWIWWGLAGGVAGLAYLTKPNIVLLLPLLALWIWWSREIRTPARAVAALLAGFLLSLSPAVGRNVAVGAPPLKTTTRGAVAFINGNNPYHLGTGWLEDYDQRVTDYARSIMSSTRGRLVPTIIQVMRGWQGDPVGWVWLQVRKLGYLLAPYEMPNNASFSYFRLNSPVLSLGLPTFYIISPLAALGLAGAMGAWRRWAPHHLFLLIGIAATVAFYVIARFRTPFLPLLLVLAGVGTDRLLGELSGRSWGRLGGSLALVAGLLAVNTAVTFPDRSLVRPQDYYIGAGALTEEGDHAGAALELEEGLRIFPVSFPLRLEAAKAWERAGRPVQALNSYREALQLEPRRGPALREVIRRLEARVGERRESP